MHGRVQMDPTQAVLLSISLSLCPEMLLVHIIYFQSLILKSADTCFDSTNIHTVVSVLEV
jgi:hypothetical protein